MTQQQMMPGPRANFSFSPQSVLTLTNLGLNQKIISELEDVAYREYGFIMYIRSKPPKKQTDNELARLKKHLTDVKESYSKLHVSTMRTLVGFQKFKLIPVIDETIDLVDKLLSTAGKVGNVTTDLDALVYWSVDVLIKNGIEVKQYSNLVNDVLVEVFYSLGESPSGIPTALKKAWHSKPDEMGWYAPYRPYCIDKLIERTKLGLGDDD